MKNNKANFSPAKIILFSAVAVLLVLSIFLLVSNITVIDGKIYSRSATELDCSGADIDDYSAFSRFSQLEFLDLRNTDITIDEYLELSEALEDCTILWSAPIGTATFDSSCTAIKLDSAEGVTAGQLDALVYMPNLVSFDISGSGVDADAGAKLNQLAGLLPGCTFSWDIEIGGVLFPHSSTEIVLPAGTPEEDYDKLLLFRSLASLDATAVGYSEKLAKITAQLSEGEFLWYIDLAGVNVLSSAEEADISGSKVEDLDAFSESLRCLPSLKKLVMCNCGLSNEQMEQLIAAHPTIKFVWTISFARWTDIRTDITCFSSLNHSKQMYGEKELEPLFKYCTDLVALDLGHSSIKDITLISNLTKLQALILGDNDITDISPLGALTQLEYVELWKNEFTDISVLTTLPNLKDINLAYCSEIENFEPLFSLPCVEMLWLQNSDFPDELPDRLEEKYPDCMFSFYKYNSSHGNGWCPQDRYLGIRKAFRNWQYVICYTSWDNVVYQDGVKLLPAIKKWD